MTISPKTLFATGILATLGLAALPDTAAAQSISCGNNYTVRAGDSLSAIAARAYGDPKAFQFIYSANSAQIGSNPGIIRLGDTWSTWRCQTRPIKPPIKSTL